MLDTIPHIFHNLKINKEIYIPLANSCYNVETDLCIPARVQNFLMMYDYWLYKHPAQSYFPFFFQPQWWLHSNWRLRLTVKWAGFKEKIIGYFNLFTWLENNPKLLWHVCASNTWMWTIQSKCWGVVCSSNSNNNLFYDI